MAMVPIYFGTFITTYASGIDKSKGQWQKHLTKPQEETNLALLWNMFHSLIPETFPRNIALLCSWPVNKNNAHHIYDQQPKHITGKHLLKVNDKIKAQWKSQRRTIGCIGINIFLEMKVSPILVDNVVTTSRSDVVTKLCQHSTNVVTTLQSCTPREWAKE